VKHRCFILLVLALLVGLLPAAAQETQTLTVFAAASLTDAFTEIEADFEAEHPGADVVFSFAGSSTLAAQLAEGAPADVFASANNTQMTAAVDAERIGGEPVPFVNNRLLLIVPADNPAQIDSFAALATPGIKLVLAAPGVPVRDYTDRMLELLVEDADYGEAYRIAVLANLVSEEDNVRQVAAKVALGEADAGIVYSSDVTPDIAEAVIALPIPDEINTLASYPIAITDDTPNPELAQAFVDYVLSEAGQATLVKWGFISVIEPEPEATAEATPEITLESDG
jgi:molybdate transport system substrate-binding protein